MTHISTCVIVWFAVVFGINNASNPGVIQIRKLYYQAFGSNKLENHNCSTFKIFQR